MRYIRNSLKYAFVAANIVAAAGSFEAANRMHDNPTTTTEDMIETIFMRPVENYDRTLYGHFADASGKDMAVDAALARTIGNRLNGLTMPENNTDIPSITVKGTMALPAVALAPATWVGGLAGTAVGAIGLHFDD